MDNATIRVEARIKAKRITHKYFDDVFVALGKTRRNARKRVEAVIDLRDVKIPKGALAELEVELNGETKL